MPDRDPRNIAVWAAAALAVLALAGWYVARRHAHEAAGAAPVPAISIATPGGGRLIVDVAGAVRRPGVYRLAAGARVEDALRHAGGPTRRADLAQINRAQKLEDGRQVLVPARGAGTGEAAGASGVTAAATGAAAAGAAGPVVPINLNTATLDQLEQLDGVGPATAQKILDFRRTHGGFGSVDELRQVPGIGDKRLAGLRDHVRV